MTKVGELVAKLVAALDISIRCVPVQTCHHDVDADFSALVGYLGLVCSCSRHFNNYFRVRVRQFQDRHWACFRSTGKHV